jgi:hypothetical protein
LFPLRVCETAIGYITFQVGVAIKRAAFSQMSNVGMSNVQCHMYLSNDQLTGFSYLVV